MSYGQSNSFQINSYADLIKFQLMLIGRSSANVAMLDEKQLAVGVKPEENFFLAVRALDDMLAPVWMGDDDYAKEYVTNRVAPIEKRDSHKLFQFEMKLIAKAHILIYIEEIEVHDPDAKIWAEKDAQETEQKRLQKLQEKQSELDSKIAEENAEANRTSGDIFA